MSAGNYYNGVSHQLFLPQVFHKEHIQIFWGDGVEGVGEGKETEIKLKEKK